MCCVEHKQQQQKSPKQKNLKPVIYKQVDEISEK